MPRRPAAWFSIGDLGKPGNHGARNNCDTGVPRGAWAADYPTSQSTSPRRSSAILRSSASSRSRLQRRELAQQMAAHESPRTTALYDRQHDEVAVDEVERILI